jgi:hypothetical protein
MQYIYFIVLANRVLAVGLCRPQDAGFEHITDCDCHAILRASM